MEPHFFKWNQKWNHNLKFLNWFQDLNFKWNLKSGIIMEPNFFIEFKWNQKWNQIRKFLILLKNFAFF